MKTKIFIFTPIILISLVFGLQSCKDDKSSNEIISETNQETVIEILQEKQRFQFANQITEEENTEYLNGEYIQRIKPMFSKQNSKRVEQNDTIDNADEIPIITYENINQLIYSDGTFTFESIDVTPDDMKFIENMNVYLQPENEKIVKTVIKDNFAYLYNPNGDLIRKESIGNVNFKSMLDSLENYMNTSSQGINGNGSKIRANKALNKALAGGMKLVRQDANEIIMEMSIENSESTFPNRVKSSVIKKSVMRFSPDMKQMYSQKTFEGSQLIQSVEIEYANDQPQYSNAASGVIKEMLPTANIKLIKHKKLSFKQDGTPYIMNNFENYIKNQVTFNFKNK
jgi:hypothetical protein